MNTDPDRKMMTPRDLAVDPEIRIPEKTSANYRCSGVGPAYHKIGRRILYRRSDVIAWLNARRVTTRDVA